MTTLYIILGIIAVLILWVIAIYNRFITLTNRVKEAWSDIDVQFKRRYDLIPNLVSTVKGYATHENSVFDNVTKARAQALSATGMDSKGKAEEGLSTALKSVFAIAEAYPELKANQNFLALQNELSDTENKIQAARRFYNGVVQELKNALQSFPSNIIGNSFHFTSPEFFQLDASDSEAKNPVKVSF